MELPWGREAGRGLHRNRFLYTKLYNSNNKGSIETEHSKKRVSEILLFRFQDIYYQLKLKQIRDAPIDRPVIGIGRSVSRLADSEPILLLPAAQAETPQPRAHSQ